MATLWISEYSNVENGIPVQPPVATQALSIGGSSTQSAAFNAATNYVELTPEGFALNYVFGTDPTAVYGEGSYFSGGTRLFRIPNNQGYKIAFIEGA